MLFQPRDELKLEAMANHVILHRSPLNVAFNAYRRAILRIVLATFELYPI